MRMYMWISFIDIPMSNSYYRYDVVNKLLRNLPFSLWITLSWTLVIWNSKVFIPENSLENVFCKMGSILSRPRCYKYKGKPCKFIKSIHWSMTKLTILWNHIFKCMKIHSGCSWAVTGGLNHLQQPYMRNTDARNIEITHLKVASSSAPYISALCLGPGVSKFPYKLVKIGNSLLWICRKTILNIHVSGRESFSYRLMAPVSIEIPGLKLLWSGLALYLNPRFEPLCLQMRHIRAAGYYGLLYTCTLTPAAVL